MTLRLKNRTTATMTFIVLALAFAAYTYVPASHWYIIPVAAHTAGANETLWRTDILLTNPNDSAILANISVLASTNGERPDDIQVLIPSRGSYVIEDVLGEFSTTENWSAEIGINIQTNYSIYVESHTYNVNPDNGTYGQEIQPLIDDEFWESIICMDDIVYIPVSMTQEYRTNIGFSNWSGSTSFDYTATLYANGSVIDSEHPVHVGPQRVVIAGVYELFPGFTGDGVVAIQPVGTPTECPTLVWGSIVDNTSGDARFLYGRNGRIISLGEMGITFSPEAALE